MTRLQALNRWNTQKDPLPGYQMADTCRHRPEDRLFIMFCRKVEIGAVTEDGHTLSQGGLKFFRKLRQKLRSDRERIVS